MTQTLRGAKLTTMQFEFTVETGLLHLYTISTVPPCHLQIPNSISFEISNSCA